MVTKVYSRNMYLGNKNMEKIHKVEKTNIDLLNSKKITSSFNTSMLKKLLL